MARRRPGRGARLLSGLSASLKLSVCTITYNHERFLAQALDSALAQDTDFEFEIVVGEDCSKDRTREILASYAERFPGKIRPLLHESNLGINRNLAETLRACSGEYVALLEGDDFWTNPRKLQRQVEFLDAHRDFALCFHDVEILDDDGARTRARAPVGWRRELSLGDLFGIGNFIPTCSEVFRNRDFTTLPDWFFTLPIGDFALNCLTAAHGRIHFLPEALATYRRHAAGAFSGESTARNVEQFVRAVDLLNEHFGFEFDRRARATRSYWLAVQAFRVGDVEGGRKWARETLSDRVLSQRGIAASLMLFFPSLYNAYARRRDPVRGRPSR